MKKLSAFLDVFFSSRIFPLALLFAISFALIVGFVDVWIRGDVTVVENNIGIRLSEIAIFVLIALYALWRITKEI